jgi:hypothetical protein
MANLIVFGKSNGTRTAYSKSRDVDNLCRYVLGESGKHEKSDILATGAYGVNDHAGIQTMCEQIKKVQKVHRIEQRGGRRMAHLCLSVTEEEFGRLGCNEDLLTEYFSDCAKSFYDNGYQLVYGVHLNSEKEHSGEEKDKTHAFAHGHFGISSININTGNKFHMTGQERRDTEAEENSMLAEYTGRSAVGFKDAEVWRERRKAP